MGAVVAPLSMRKSTKPASPTSRVTTTYPALGLPGIPIDNGTVVESESFDSYASAKAFCEFFFRIGYSTTRSYREVDFDRLRPEDIMAGRAAFSSEAAER